MIGDYGAAYYDTAYCIVSPIRGGIVGRCAYGLLVQSSVDAFEIPGFVYIWFEALHTRTFFKSTLGVLMYRVNPSCVYRNKIRWWYLPACRYDTMLRSLTRAESH